jgi:outer membrane protein OmpA-like peptidoglycan-associated protein
MRFLYAFLLLFSASMAAAQSEQKSSIYFEFDKWELDEDAKHALRELADYYKDKYLYKELTDQHKITLKGYCDTIGSLTYNDRLARQRVFAVHNYLLNIGLPKNVFELVKGYGKRMPVNSNMTDEERRLNRRVDIIFPLEVEAPPPPVPDPPVVEPPPDTVKDFTSTSIDSVKQGDVLRLKNINFYGGRHTFLPQSIPALNELLDVMRKYPDLEIEIQGHICCRIGSGVDGADFDSGDEQLSVNRARAVYYFLADNGISKRRMTYRGFAALYPLINPERSDTDRTLNRRVEIKITKK